MGTIDKHLAMQMRIRHHAHRMLVWRTGPDGRDWELRADPYSEAGVSMYNGFMDRYLPPVDESRPETAAWERYGSQLLELVTESAYNRLLVYKEFLAIYEAQKK